MFSLCIPTMDRYDKFLSKYLPKYLSFDLIDEIIISDENGNDATKILNAFGNNSKIKININDVRKGPFLNKYTCCKLAKNEWIALIDSDNFADNDYFIAANNFIKQNITNQNVILSPSFAKPTFNFTHLSGYVYNKNSLKNNKMLENNNPHKKSDSDILMNTGNYVLNKYLIHNINLHGETDTINQSSACDVIYLNTLLFEQLDMSIYIVPEMSYEHVVHNGSIYIKTNGNTRDCIKKVHERYYKLLHN